MPDQEIKIVTTADTAGAQAAAAAMKEVDAATAEATVTTGEYIAQSQREAAAQMEGVEAEKALTDAQIQRQAIYSTKLEAIQLEAAGRTEEAAALDREVQLMTASLVLQKELNITQADSLLLAEQMVAAKAAIAAADTEDAVATTSSLRGIGYSGRATQTILSSLGLGGIAGAAGLGAFGGYEVYELIKRQTEALEKEYEAQVKVNAAFDKQLDTFQNLSTAAQGEAITKIYDTIAEKQQQRAVATGAEAEALDGEIAALETQANFLTVLARQTAERKEAEDTVLAAINAQTEAYREQGRISATLIENDRQKLEAANKLLEAQKAGAALEIDLAVKTGKMTPEQGEEAKTGLDERADKIKFDNEQAEKQREIDRLRAEMERARENAATAQRELDAANQKASAALQANAGAQAGGARIVDAEQAVNTARAAFDEAKAQEVFNSGSIEAAQAAQAQTAAAAAALQTAQATLTSLTNEHRKSVDETTAALTRQLAVVKALTAQLAAAKEAEKQASDDPAKIEALNTQIKNAFQLQDVLSKNAALKGQIDAAGPRAGQPAASAADDQAQVKFLEGLVAQTEADLRTESASGNKEGVAQDLSRLTGLVQSLALAVVDLNKNKVDTSQLKQEMDRIEAIIASYRPGT